MLFVILFYIFLNLILLYCLSDNEMGPYGDGRPSVHLGDEGDLLRAFRGRGEPGQDQTLSVEAPVLWRQAYPRLLCRRGPDAGGG